MMQRIVQLIVPRQIPSLNVFMRQHHLERLKERNMWRAEVRAVVTPSDRQWLKAQAELHQRMRVQIESRRKRLMDEDNLTVKHVLDALIFAGFLWDDSPEALALELSQIVWPKCQTVITIRNAE